MSDRINYRVGAQATMAASAQTRTSFTTQFLRGAARFASLSREIENRPIADVDEDAQSDHLAFVTGAVMQSCAALEAEITDVVEHGPGNHLGSNGIDLQGKNFLLPLADAIDAQSALEKYQLVLHLLQKKPFDKGADPFQKAAILVRLRNEITHYRSKWGSDMDAEKLFKSLGHLHLRKPLFVSENTNFFPRKCLGADCAVWAVVASVAFIEEFYVRLGMPSPLASHRAKILVEV